MIAPLMFGAQRFGASEGLQIEKSALQDGVAGGLGWASGDFGLIGGGEGSRRRLDGNTAPPTYLYKLYNQLLTTLIAVSAVVLMEALAVVYWRHRANRHYYVAQSINAFNAEARQRAAKLGPSGGAPRDGTTREATTTPDREVPFAPFPKFLIVSAHDLK